MRTFWMFKRLVLASAWSSEAGVQALDFLPPPDV